MGEEDSRRGMELKVLYRLYLDKIKALKSILESMESAYGNMDITRCSDKVLKMFMCSDEMLSLAMEGIQSKLKEMGELHKG
ncbi:hypothetical protein ES702_04985 [subsurface metagenome]